MKKGRGRGFASSVGGKVDTHLSPVHTSSQVVSLDVRSSRTGSDSDRSNSIHDGAREPTPGGRRCRPRNRLVERGQSRTLGRPALLEVRISTRVVLVVAEGIAVLLGRHLGCLASFGCRRLSTPDGREGRQNGRRDEADGREDVLGCLGVGRNLSEGVLEDVGVQAKEGRVEREETDDPGPNEGLGVAVLGCDGDERVRGEETSHTVGAQRGAKQRRGETLQRTYLGAGEGGKVTRKTHE